MTIGTTASFTVTRNELVELALSEIGVSEPQNEDMALGIKLLNAMIRNLDAHGTWLWAISNTESTLTLVAGQASYATGITSTTIASDILKLAYAATYINTRHNPLIILDKMTSLSNDLRDDSNGEPRAVYLHRGNLRSDNQMIFYPTPNSAYTIKYTYRRALYDFSLSTDNPDFPQVWFVPLYKRLAYLLCPHYSKPLSERQLLKAEADEEMEKARKFNSDKPSYITLKPEFM